MLNSYHGKEERQGRAEREKNTENKQRAGKIRKKGENERNKIRRM
jgi:hypothetical protein